MFSADEYAQMRAFFAGRPELAPTPLRELPALARDLGIGRLFAKDESGRFGLNAFKLLGARFAVETLLKEGAIRPGATLVCASEGNHGRAVARAARDAGCAARVYMAHDASPSRVNAIAGEGAEVIKVDGSYDDAVRIMQAEADKNQWTIVSDTAWEGYERIPRLIMLGYTRMLDEVRQRSASGFRCHLRPGRRRRIVVRHGELVRVPSAVRQAQASPERSQGAANRIRAWWPSSRPPRRACRPPRARERRWPSRAHSPPRWPACATAKCRRRRSSRFSRTSTAFMAIDDAWSDEATRALGRPRGEDPAIAAGSSGAAAVGGLLALCRDVSLAEARARLGLSSSSRVLAIVSEGVTDPEVWRTAIAGG